MKLLACLLLAVVLVPTAFVIGSLFVPASTNDSSEPSAAASPFRRSVVEVDSNGVVLQALSQSSEGRGSESYVSPTSATPDTTRNTASKAHARRERAERQIREQTLERAHRLAEGAGLDAEGERILADLLIGQRQRLLDMRTTLAEVPSAERKRALRAGTNQVRVWYQRELSARFDPDTVERIQKPGAKTRPESTTARDEADRAAAGVLRTR